MLNIRTVLLSVALVVIALIAVPLVAARTEVASGPSSNPVIALDHQNRYDKMTKVRIPSYHSPLDVCYDVGLMERAKCLGENQKFVQLYRFPLDECSDVGLIYRAQCLSESQASIP
jgi:hypothetical protein